MKAVLDGPQGADVKAILPVHLFGQCADWTAFPASRKERGLKLIEDAAQAWGAEWNGVKAGALGDAAAFSFYPTKNLSAAGDAGMVTTNSDELAERARMLRQHGMRRRYYHDEVGWNTRMDGFQGAILGVKLKYIDGWNQPAAPSPGAITRSFTPPGLVEAGPYPMPRRRAAPGASRHPSRLAPVRDPHCPPRRPAPVPHRAPDRLGDLLPRPAASARGVQEPRLQRGQLPRGRTRRPRSPGPAHLPRAARRRAADGGQRNCRVFELESR